MLAMRRPTHAAPRRAAGLPAFGTLKRPTRNRPRSARYAHVAVGAYGREKPAGARYSADRVLCPKAGRSSQGGDTRCAGAWSGPLITVVAGSRHHRVVNDRLANPLGQPGVLVCSRLREVVRGSRRLVATAKPEARHVSGHARVIETDVRPGAGSDSASSPGRPGWAFPV